MNAARLPPGQQLVAAGKWPIIGERTPRDDPSPWTVAVCGLVAKPRQFSLAELEALPQAEREIDLHCVTRWSRLGARFRGVPLSVLLNCCAPLPDARYVSFVARSGREHSTSLPLVAALQLDTLIALHHEDQPLAVSHGGPVRTVVPHRYFYKSLKWLARIELLAEDRLGYWEREASYHNSADPQREERYLASQLDRREVQRLLSARDFTGLDLRGMCAAGHDLMGLLARGALLRDADFRRGNLQHADFAGTNLSNACFQAADLRGVSFANADVEGADFTAADLRGADFRGASLTAATFLAEHQAGARIDATTLFDPEALEQLMPPQAEYVRSHLNQRGV